MKDRNVKHITPHVKNHSHSDQKPLVSILVPVYNEEIIIENNLSVLCQYMNSLEDQYRWELIIINDGSTDRTGELAEAFTKNIDNAYVLNHIINFRLGQALRFGINKSRGNYIVVMDIDLSYSPDHIKKMLDKIRETKAKIVIASPYTKGGKVSNIPWIRKKLSAWGNQFLCFVFPKNWFSDKLTNITGMVRAYDGRFIRAMNLKAMDFDINHEIIYKANILRARIVEVPAHLNWQLGKSGGSIGAKRKSNIKIVRTIVQSFISGFIFRPFLFFIIPGLIIFLFSLYPISWTFIHTASYYKKTAYMDLPFINRLAGAMGEAFKNFPHAFVIGGIALMVAIQLISSGLLALQKKRYYDELFHLGTSLRSISQLNKENEIIEDLSSLTDR